MKFFHLKFQYIVKMPKNQHVPLKVIKVPLDRTVRTSFRKDFPRMSRLYLELIENTRKIIPNYIGKEFIPNYDNVKDSPLSLNEENLRNLNRSSNSDKSRRSYNQSIFNDSDSDDDIMSIKSNVSSISDAETNTKDDDDDDELTKQLKTLLDEDETSSIGDLTPRSTHRSGRSKRRTPPTLDQLKQTGAYRAPKIIKELAGDDDDDDEDKKRELLFKFDLLKKSYKGSHVPEFSIHSDYKTMESTYEHTVKKLSLDSTVE